MLYSFCLNQKQFNVYFLPRQNDLWIIKMASYYSKIVAIALNFKSNNGHIGVVHQILTDTAVEEMRNPFSSVRTHTYQLGIDMSRKVQDPLFHICVIIYIKGIIFDVQIFHKIFHQGITLV